MEARRTGMGWTYAEFARLPSEGGTRHEVVAGELVVTPAPGVRHQDVVTRLAVRLRTFVDAHRLGTVLAGPIDVLFGEGDYLEPDLVVVLEGSAHLLSDRGIEGPPELVVEVVSPSTAARDRGVKLERYRAYGVPEYWVVDPEGRRIEVWHFARGAEGAVIYGDGDPLEWDPGTGPNTLELPVEDVLG